MTAARRTTAPGASRVPAELYFVGSAIFHYLGPSFAVLLFARVPVAGVAWFRIVSAALVFAVWRRPWRALLAADRRTRWRIGALGAVFALMNYAFYMAIDVLPLGTVAAIEFVGPIVLAVVGVRSWNNLAAVAMAVTGLLLLTVVAGELARGGGGVAGIAWALANSVLFTLYIVLAHRVARADPTTDPIDRLAAAMLIAGVAITPVGLAGALPAMGDPVAVAAGIGVGISSSVIPYAFDQRAMARLARSTYALFVALLPATAVVIGVVVLGQVPTWVEAGAVVLIIGGVLLHRETPPTGAEVPSPGP